MYVYIHISFSMSIHTYMAHRDPITMLAFPHIPNFPTLKGPTLDSPRYMLLGNRLAGHLLNVSSHGRFVNKVNAATWQKYKRGPGLAETGCGKCFWGPTEARWHCSRAGEAGLQNSLRAYFHGQAT